MTSDDPFGEAEPERTFIMPSPAQRSSRAPYSQAATPPQAVGIEELMPARGLNPLVAAASPLFNAVPQLRASLAHPDPAALRENFARGIRAFEARAAREGVLPQHVVAARYALCTLLDETAASTPWGGSGAWGHHSLLVLFHNEAWGGEKVFQLMAKVAENPAANRDLLEFLYVVLALGFEGRYRRLDNGRGQLEQLRERLLGMVKEQRGPYESDLSPRWKGVEARAPTFLALPMWIVLALAGVVAVGLYLLLSLRLNRDSDPVYAGIQAIHVRTPVPALQAAPAARPRLAAFLEPEIRAGLVGVADFADRSVVTIRGDGLFEPGGTTISATVRPLIDRIGQALAAVPGAVVITGHTDNQPIRSARFPSNWHLSKERAASVQALLAPLVGPDRLKAEGRADEKPVAGNATPEDRARNRRVEITLYVAAPTPGRPGS